jgi:hypothetical protein
MPSPWQTFRKHVARVKEDSKKETEQLVDDLKRKTPAEFLRLPARTFASLTTEQYRDVVRTIAPDINLPTAATADELAVKPRNDRHWWRERSALTHMMIITVAATISFTALALASPWVWKWTLNHMEIVRPVSTATWPVCSRLSPYTDGCVYYVAQDLNWSTVAQQLGMSAQELYQANRHLPPQFIPAKSTLVVWRHRGRLEN